MSKADLKRTCIAKAKNTGRRCQFPAIPGGTVCRYHGGGAPQTIAAANFRLLAAIDPVMAELIRIALKGKSEAVRVQAIKEVLERAGFGDPKRLAISQVPDPATVADWIAAIEKDLAESE